MIQKVQLSNCNYKMDYKIVNQVQGFNKCRFILSDVSLIQAIKFLIITLDLMHPIDMIPNVVIKVSFLKVIMKTIKECQGVQYIQT